MELATRLDELVRNKTITSFLIQQLDEDGNVGQSKYRNTERLVITFPNGEKLAIGTFCSGCREDTSLHLDTEIHKNV